MFGSAFVPPRARLGASSALILFWHEHVLTSQNGLRVLVAQLFPFHLHHHVLAVAARLPPSKGCSPSSSSSTTSTGILNSLSFCHVSRVPPALVSSNFVASNILFLRVLAGAESLKSRRPTDPHFVLDLHDRVPSACSFAASLECLCSCGSSSKQTGRFIPQVRGTSLLFRLSLIIISS